MDIAKANLHLYLAGRDHALPNTPAGHRRLCQLLAAMPGSHVVCEATGGYERDVVAALHHAGVLVSVLNPARVSHFARAQGQRTIGGGRAAVRRALYMAALSAARCNRHLRSFYQVSR